MRYRLRGARWHDRYNSTWTRSRLKETALDANELGEILRTRRRALKMSLAEVAELAGVSTSFVSQVERGVANPTLATLKSLTEADRKSVV